MNIKTLIKTLTLTLTLAVTLASCSKNEFDITGKLKSVNAQNLRFLYYASDSKKGFVVESPVAVVNGELKLHGVTHNPTVVWVIDGQGRLVNLIYVERGDNLKVSGDLNKPWLWEIKGNKTEEELSAWIRQNSAALLTSDPKELNKASAAYVNQHPQSLAAAIILAAFYQPVPGHQTEYDALLAKIPKENYSNSAVVAAGSLDMYCPVKKVPDTVEPFSLYNFKGEVDTIKFKKHPATLLYFWRKSDDGTVRAGGEDNHKFNILMLKNLREQYGDSRLQIVDINCDLDTMQWYRAARNDSVARWSRLWEPGYGMGEVTGRLGVTGMPYLILTDSTGRIRLRGYDIDETERTLRQILK